MTRIIVSGAGGRMGSCILALAGKDHDFEIAGALEAKGSSLCGQKAASGNVTVTDDLASLKGKADVLIDFTTPAATLSHLETVSGWKGFAAVIGTTGFSKEEQSRIKDFAKKIPILLSPNMSLGVNLLLEFVGPIARQLAVYDIEIIESHHSQKKDAPSGTALALAGEIAQALERNLDKNAVYGRKGNVGARTPAEIGIHAIRGGDIVGDHTVLFAGNGERIEISHKASSRDAFAAGALRAAAWISGREPGLYSMRDILQG